MPLDARKLAFKCFYLDCCGCTRIALRKGRWKPVSKQQFRGRELGGGGDFRATQCLPLRKGTCFYDNKHKSNMGGGLRILGKRRPWFLGGQMFGGGGGNRNGGGRGRGA